MGLAASKQEAFWEACGFGHTNRVKRFIDEGIDVNWVSYTHNSCAIHVASQGKEEIVKMLIHAKCKINVKDDRGNLALHHAAMKGHAKIMQILIDAGSEIDTQDKNGWTPLLNASYFCQPEAVETLIKNNCDVNLLNKDERTALHEACRSQNEDDNGLAIICCHLVEAGSDVNAKSSDLGEADFTSLMFASYHGHAGMAEVLIGAGCDINAQGTNGWSALHWAVDRDNKDVAKVLVESGIDVLLEGRRGELALDRAKDSELREALEEVTSEAKFQREMDEMTSRSPVSTTSPLSSSCSSLHSDLDEENTVTHRTIEGELAAKLGEIVLEREGDSSGSVSEKGETEALEKNIVDDSPTSDSLGDDTVVSESSVVSREIVAMVTEGSEGTGIVEATQSERECEKSEGSAAECSDCLEGEKMLDQSKEPHKDPSMKCEDGKTICEEKSHTGEELKVSTEEPETCEEPKMDNEKPNGIIEGPQVLREEPRVTGEEPKASSEEPMVPSEEPMAPSEEPMAPSKEPRVTGEEPKAPSEEPKAPSEEPKVTGEEPMAPSKEPNMIGEEPMAPSKEPNVTGEEPKMPSEEPQVTSGVTKEPRVQSEELETASEEPSVTGKELHNGDTPPQNTESSETELMIKTPLSQDQERTAPSDTIPTDCTLPKHDAVARLLTETDHDDGNISDDLLADGGYSDGLVDSDME